MQTFYDILDTLKDQLELDTNVNTVSQGAIDDIDIIKQSMYPIAHIMVNQATIEVNVWRFNVTIFCMDVVDINNDLATNSIKNLCKEGSKKL